MVNVQDGSLNRYKDEPNPFLIDAFHLKSGDLLWSFSDSVMMTSNIMDEGKGTAAHGYYLVSHPLN